MLTAPNPAPAFDAMAFRRQFPALSHAVHLATCPLGARSSRLDLDLMAVQSHVAGLVDYATNMLTAQVEKVRLPANRTARGAHVALVEPAAVAVARWLANRRVVVAPRGAAVRLAFHAYNALADVDAACATITAYRKATAWTS
jgi:kynureninase